MNCDEIVPFNYFQMKSAEKKNSGGYRNNEDKWAYTITL